MKLESALLDLSGLDLLAARKSPVHRLDPRAKVVTALAFILTIVSFNKHDLSGLLPFFLYPVALVAVGGLPPGWLAGKVLVASPLALAFAIFNPLFDREILVQFGPLDISGGWISFCSILLRFLLTLSAALILIATTGFDAVCLALARLRVPRVLVTQLMLLYRYIFVLGSEATRTTRAWRLRAAEGRRPTMKVFGSLVGQLLLRALDRAQRIHMAMLCRGFDGEIRLTRGLRLRPADAAFVLGWTGFFILARAVDLPQWLGALVTGGRP